MISEARPEPSNNAEALLQVNLDNPESLFSFDAAAAQIQWRKLRAHWHPDRNVDPQAKWVFAHLTALHQAAEEKRAGGIWSTPGLLSLTTECGRSFRLRYWLRRELDLGHAFYARHHVAYVIKREFDDLVTGGYQTMLSLPFSDESMRAAMEPALPGPHQLLRTPSSTVVVLNKRAEFIPLSALRDALGGKLEPVHVAWVVSALLNLCCYLEQAGFAHHAIDCEHLLVSPENHALQLAGGWWFATRQDAPLQALPARSMQLSPPDVLARRCGDVRLDQFLARATALELLGNNLSVTPAPMQAFLTLPPAPTAVEDYAEWQRCLWPSFGERRFVHLPISSSDVYAHFERHNSSPAST